MATKVKYTSKGDVKLKLSAAQYEDFLTFLDWLPEYQRNSYMTPQQLVWNIVLQKVRDRYVLAQYLPNQDHSVTLKMEEAVILKSMYQICPGDTRGIIEGVMMELDRIVVSHA